MFPWVPERREEAEREEAEEKGGRENCVCQLPNTSVGFKIPTFKMYVQIHISSSKLKSNSIVDSSLKFKLVSSGSHSVCASNTKPNF